MPLAERSRVTTSLRSLEALLTPVGVKLRVMLTVGMVVLGLATFAALIGFVTLCDRV